MKLDIYFTRIFNPNDRRAKDTERGILCDVLLSIVDEKVTQCITQWYFTIFKDVLEREGLGDPCPSSG